MAMIGKEKGVVDYQTYLQEELSDREILRSFALVLPYLNAAVRDDMAFAVSDLEKYLAYTPAEGFDIDLEYGDKVVELVEECIRRGEVQRGDIPEHILGTAIKVIAIPIKNAVGKVIGTFSNGIDMGNNRHDLSVRNPSIREKWPTPPPIWRKVDKRRQR